MTKRLNKFTSSVISLVLCFAMLLTVVPPITANATSGSWTGGQVCKGYRLKVTYSESAKNPKTNTSKVTANLYLVQDKTYDLYISTRTATITINGTKKTISNIPAIQNGGGVTTKLGSASKTITHTSDGSKSIKISATFQMNATLAGTYYGTMSTSKTVALDKLDRTAPTVTLKFNSATANSVTLTATANKTCDNWQYSTNGGSSWNSFGSSGTSNKFTISNLSGGTAYSVVARARNTTNNVTSAKSSAVTATTKPKPPGGLKIDSATQTTLNCSWNASTGAKSYKVYLNDTLKASGLTSRNYTFTELTPNTSYKIGVCATGSSGDSSISSLSNNLTLPNTPTNLEVTDKTDNSVALKWSYDVGGNAADATTFNIYRDGVNIGTSETTVYTDTLYPNIDCEYTVTASTSAGETSQSESVTVTHIPLSITLNPTNHFSYVLVTPTFTGGINRELETNSLKWAYGEQNADYFEENGYAFANEFAVLQNGTYTVFAKDIEGNEAIAAIEIDGIYTKPTQSGFVQSFTDLSVDSIGLPIAFERTYNSMDNLNSIFGAGWSLNYAKATILSEDETVRLVYLPDGTINYFSLENDAYTGINTQSTLIADGNKLILTTKENIKYTYENNYLTRIEDNNGNATVIELNSENLPVKITDSVGREYTIAYSNNKITSITDPAGRVFTYVYDENGRLVEQNSAGGGVVNKFVYTNGLLTKITDVLDNTLYEIAYNNQKQVVNITDSEEETTYYQYNITTSGELAIYESDSEIVLNDANEPEASSSVTENHYNSFGLIIFDSEGLSYKYNSNGTLSSINMEDTAETEGEDGEETQSEESEVFEKVTYSYDDKGNETRIITKDEDQKLLEDVTYTYTYFENTSNISSLTETTVTYNYNEETGEQTDTETETVTSAYDVKGNLLSERTVKGEADNTVTYTYNNKGLLLSETDGDTVTEYTYDENGYVTNLSTAENNVETNVTSSYNIIGLVLSQTENGLTTTNIYDLFGNVIKQTLSDGTTTRITRIVYDNNNRAIQKIYEQQYNESDDGLSPDNNGICTSNVYNNSNVGERYTYDSKGNVLTYINVANNKTVNTYDSEDRLVKTVTYETPSSTENGLTTRYVYNTDGNLTQTVYPHQYNAENDNLDVSNNINTYTDNTIGERATYDEKGNVLTYTDSFGKETVNIYDSNNHIVKSICGDEITRYVYNGGENLLQVIYPDQYNAENDNLDLSAETPVDTYSNQNVGDRYTYNDEGNILTYTNQFGDITTNTYDSEGNLASTTKPDGTVFAFDDEGRAERETYANGLTRDFTYSDNQTIISGSNGINITYNLNAFGEIEEYKLQNGENNKNYSYTYDSNGNITTISLNSSLQQTFTYNSSNELVRVDDAVINKTVTYIYDYVGNITSVKTYDYTTETLGTPLSTENYTYNSQNQRTDLGYDANGNLTSLGGFAFGWTDRRLTSVTSEDTNISYAYNHNGIRTSKTVGDITTTYKVDENNNVIKQTDGTNTIKFVYDNNSSPIYMVYNETLYYYEKNLQGDIVGILDQNGNTVVEYTYDIWGKLVNTTGTLADTIGAINPLRYRGYYYDSETDLYYLQSRYYSPDLMRFISQDDPVFSNDQGQPLGSNLYVYCLNNAVMNSDANGYYTVSSLKKKSWLFKLASKFGINIERINKTVKKQFFRINLWLVRLVFSVSVGLTKNYKAGISFNFTRKSIGVSKNIGMGAGYSISYAYALSWKSITRSMSLVYSAKNDGVYASLNVELEINHIVSAAVAVACVYWPALSPVLSKLLVKSRTIAVGTMSILAPIVKYAYLT